MTEATRIRAAVRDGITEVRLRMAHTMETGHRRDASGARIAAHLITEFTASHNGRVVLSAQFGGGISANPYLVFRFRGGAPGDTITVSWVDSRQQTRSDETRIA